MTQPVRLIGIVALVGVLLAGALMVLKSETAPMEKLGAAEKAVNDAKAAGVPTSMPDDFAKLEDLLAKARTEIEEQNAKLGFLRTYAKADQLLTAVLTEAARLIAEAGKRQEEAKAAAVQAQRTAQEAVTQAQDLLEGAPAGKEQAALTLIKADIRKLGASLSEVQAALDSRNYQAAEAKANEIREKAQGVAAELRQAIEKVKKASKKAKR